LKWSFTSARNFSTCAAQLVLPNYVARAKVSEGVLRPVIEQTFPPALTPAPSALCKMG